MISRIEEAMNTIAEVLLLLLLAILPLYMQDKMVMIGDAKYVFFRNFSLILLVISVVGAVLWKFCGGKSKRELSTTDLLVLLFAISAIGSFLGSAYKETALWGFADWHMGLFTQLLFVWIYFCVSRWYDGRDIVWKVAAAAAGVVFGLGLLNRMGIDPLGIYEGMPKGDWNRNNLLSTIGNSNWYCGYASVASAFVIYFAYCGKGLGRSLGLAGTFITFATFVTQGSESAYPVVAGMLVVLYFCSIESRRKLMDFIRVALLLPLSCVTLQIVEMLQLAKLELNLDGSMDMVLRFKGWWLLLLLGLGMYVGLWYREKKGCVPWLSEKDLRRISLAGMVCLVIVVVGTVVLCQVSDTVWSVLGSIPFLRLNADWGSGRGAIWYMAFMTWLQGGLRGMLIGVGPDCFAHGLYQQFPMANSMQSEGKWADMVIANAHNEGLNMLVNQGILGALVYVGIFVSIVVCLWRHRKSALLLGALLAVVGYGINGLFSFQQVVSTPLVFAVIGMAEGILRKERADTEGEAYDGRLDKAA